MKSNLILNGPEWANVRALYKSSGFTEEELKKPLIGIVNTFNEVCPGHMNLSAIAERVKHGIYASGGTPVVFSTIGACDGVAMGHEGMRYVLPTREMIANDVEAMAKAHQLDALVLLGSCDKIVPGLIMGALRLDLPTIFLSGGPSLPGHMTEKNPYGGDVIDHSIIQQSEGALKAGHISEVDFKWIEDNAVPTIGSCAMLGTANTMCALAEAMGLSLPGTSTIPAVYSQRMQMAYLTGCQIMEMVKNNLNIRSIITHAALVNAIKVNNAIGGSTNAVLHLLAIAYEAEVALTIDAFNETMPHLVGLIPAGQYTLLDLHEAGGIPAVINEIFGEIDMTLMTCTGVNLALNTNAYLEAFPIRKKGVIASLSTPFHKRGGIKVLRGNLAPDGAITKPSAIPEEALVFEGKAKIYEGEYAALEGIRAGAVRAGDVVVIRGEGPMGGPGMPEMYKAMKLLVGMKLGAHVCVITDGRFSGSNNGCFVGHMAPEAYEDGPIAYLKDGDKIVVNVLEGKIDVIDVDMKMRMKTMPSYPKRSVKGYLYQYQKLVKSASLGAIIPTRD